MQGIHTYIPVTNHVHRGYIVAAILSLVFIVPLFLVPALTLLFFYVTNSRSIIIIIIIIIINCNWVATRWLYSLHQQQIKK